MGAALGRRFWRRPIGPRYRIDPLSNRVTADSAADGDGAAFHDDGDRLWALDPATGRTLVTTAVPSFGTTSMSTAEGSLWLASSAGELLVVPRLAVRLSLGRAAAAAH